MSCLRLFFVCLDSLGLELEPGLLYSCFLHDFGLGYHHGLSYVLELVLGQSGHHSGPNHGLTVVHMVHILIKK